MEPANANLNKAREIAIHALGLQNSRFILYREQDPTFRENDVKFWSSVIASVLDSKVEDDNHEKL